MKQVLAEDGNQILRIGRFVGPDRTAGHSDEKLMAAIPHHHIADGSNVPLHTGYSGGIFKGYGDIDSLLNILETGGILNSKFHSADKITVSAMGNDKIDAILKKYESEIRDEVLAVKVEYGIVSGYSKEWSINGETVTLGVEKQ